MPLPFASQNAHRRPTARLSQLRSQMKLHELKDSPDDLARYLAVVKQVRPPPGRDVGLGRQLAVSQRNGCVDPKRVTGWSDQREKADHLIWSSIVLSFA